MKITSKQIRTIIREEILREAEDFDMTQSSINLPAYMKKMPSPDVSPANYSKLDKKLDASDKPEHQAIALISFALNYADGDEDRAANLLRRSISMLPKVIKSQKSSDVSK